MKSKKGVLMALYFVFLTLFMCALAATLFYIQAKKLQNSVVSPENILGLQDKQQLFEIQENLTIIQAGKQTLSTETWNTKGFNESLKKKLVASLLGNQDSGFLFENLSLNGENFPEGTFLQQTSKENFLNSAYNIYFKNNQLVVDRSLEKTFTLYAENRKAINFPVKVVYNSKKQYVFNQEDFK